MEIEEDTSLLKLLKSLQKELENETCTCKKQELLLSIKDIKKKLKELKELEKKQLYVRLTELKNKINKSKDNPDFQSPFELYEEYIDLLEDIRYEECSKYH